MRSHRHAASAWTCGLAQQVACQSGDRGDAAGRPRAFGPRAAIGSARARFSCPNQRARSAGRHMLPGRTCRAWLSGRPLHPGQPGARLGPALAGCWAKFRGSGRRPCQYPLPLAWPQPRQSAAERRRSPARSLRGCRARRRLNTTTDARHGGHRRPGLPRADLPISKGATPQARTRVLRIAEKQTCRTVWIRKITRSRRKLQTQPFRSRQAGPPRLRPNRNTARMIPHPS